jgi:hypothetical protein
MVDIQPALAGIGYLRDFVKYVGGLRHDAEVLGRLNEAAAKVGEVQDKLIELREDNLRLIEENRHLKAQLQAADAWNARSAAYQHVEAPGGAHVLRFEGPQPHYACPNCFEQKEIRVLQPTGHVDGSRACPRCKVTYLVDKVDIKDLMGQFGLT